jgi:hypothetical protein
MPSVAEALRAFDAPGKAFAVDVVVKSMPAPPADRAFDLFRQQPVGRFRPEPRAVNLREEAGGFDGAVFSRLFFEVIKKIHRWLIGFCAKTVCRARSCVKLRPVSNGPENS